MQGGKCRDISAIYRVSGGVDTIFSGEKSEGRYFRKNRQNIGDIITIYRLGEIYRRFLQKIGNKLPIFWKYFPSFMQHDLTAQITPVLIRRPRCDSNGNMAIQRPDCSQFLIQRLKLFFNDKLMFQRLFWPKFLL